MHISTRDRAWMDTRGYPLVIVSLFLSECLRIELSLMIFVCSQRFSSPLIRVIRFLTFDILLFSPRVVYILLTCVSILLKLVSSFLNFLFVA